MSFEEAVIISLLGYGKRNHKCLWLNFQYLCHSNLPVATPSLDMWMVQEWPYDPILANLMWGSIFGRSFGNTSPFLGNKSRRGWLPVFWTLLSLIWHLELLQPDLGRHPYLGSRGGIVSPLPCVGSLHLSWATLTRQTNLLLSMHLVKKGHRNFRD